MHACSAAIEHNLHTIQQQPIAGGHQSLLVSSSLSLSPSASSQLQLPANHPLQSSSPNLPVPPTTVQMNPLSPTLPTDPGSSHTPLFRLPSATHSTGSHNSFTSRLTTTETRLFHTLHFLILEAPNQHESEVSANELLPLNTIQLFIYLFIPYVHTYLQTNEKEFLASTDLAEGMRRIWQPLLEYRQPPIRMFNSFVKPVIPPYVTPNENGVYTSTLNEIGPQSQSFTSKKNRLSVLVEPPTSKPISSRAIIEEVDEDLQSSDGSPTDFVHAHDQHHGLPRSISEKQPLTDLTNQQGLMTAPIVSSEGSSTSLFQPITLAKKDHKSTTSIQADSDTNTTNNSITDLSAYGTSNNTKPRAPLVHMSSICSISDSSRLTTSPQSPGK